MAGEPVVSVRMSKDEAWDLLTDAHTAIFTTLRRDGVPIAMPVWFAVIDRHVYLNTRGRKLERIRRDARSSILVEDGELWRELRAVHLTGRARIIEPDPQLAARISAELDRKYAAYRTAPEDMPEATRAAYSGAAMETVEFVPDARVLNWDNGRLFAH
ncbi:MAG: pyridoxamine 5'-phosphate oxidase family protein [Acidimicrobiia bacterium]